MLERKVRGLHIVQPDSPSQGQALHRSVGDGAAKPSVLQQLLPREGLAALQLDHIPLHRFHRHKGALLHLAAGSDEPQPRPDPQGLAHSSAPRREPRTAAPGHRAAPAGGSPVVDLQPLRMGDDEAHVGLSPPREASPRFGQRNLLRFVDPKPRQELEDLLVEAPALRELVAPAPRQIMQQLAVLQLLAHLRPREAVQDGGQLREVPEQQEADLLWWPQRGTPKSQTDIRHDDLLWPLAAP